jgi:hypothetical protein
MSQLPTGTGGAGQLVHPGESRVGSSRLDEPGLADLRWLARRVLSSDRGELLLNVPVPQLISAHLTSSRPPVRDYVTWWIDHREPGSTFEARTRWLRWLPRPWLVRALQALGYGGLVYPKGEAVIGHVFFQRRGPALHGFSTAVSGGLDGAGYSVVMVLDYVAYGAQLPGIAAVRIGTGRNNTTRRLLARIRKHEALLGWRVDPDGWVTFPPGARRGP